VTPRTVTDAAAATVGGGAGTEAIVAQTIFLLSPARCDGRRARMLLAETAAFPLAERMRAAGGAPLGEAFAFMSGLYFRGKLAYARAFGRARDAADPALVIAPGMGLAPAATPIGRADLEWMATIGVSLDEPRYREPLERDAAALAARLAPEDTVVLLGSVATDKYTSVLVEALGPRLRFPVEFIGRGDMSRGGLMLRCADAGTPLTYAPIAGAIVRGPRPPKLEPLPRVR
jgi:hypothetical protein